MLEQLTLTNFRNHSVYRINTNNKNIVLFGKNGAGKTNVLEAISLLNGSTGLRSATSVDLAKDSGKDYAIVAAMSNGNTISVYWQDGSGHRKAKINGDAAPLSELAKYVRVVWLTPAEDLLFVGSPSGRRSFLDNLIAGFDSAHHGRIHRLNKLLSERAFALRNARDDKWIDLIDDNIASTATSIADARVRYTSEINHFFDIGKIALSGLAENRIIDGEKAGDFETFYRNYLSENRLLIAERMAIDGPHHSDFSVINTSLGKTADKTSSGQQKLLLYKLVIANAQLLNAKNPDVPLIVLLDEAYGHLDDMVRDALFSGLQETSAQIWLTGTNKDAFSSVPNSVIISL